MIVMLHPAASGAIAVDQTSMNGSGALRPAREIVLSHGRRA
jgi:hypothetical protein